MDALTAAELGADLGSDLGRDAEPVARRVVRLLRRAIVSMRLEPGTKLSEQDVAHRLGVSRQPVREAFIKLGEQGLVRILPQRGTLVVKITRDAVEDARFVRLAIESSLVREAALRRTPAQLAALRANQAAQRRAARSDGEGFFTLDEEFHQALAEAAGRPSAWRVVEEVKPQLDRVRFLSMGRPGSRALVLRQHAAVLDAVRAGNPDAAEGAMREHLANVLRSLPELMAERPWLFDAEG